MKDLGGGEGLGGEWLGLDGECVWFEVGSDGRRWAEY